MSGHHTAHCVARDLGRPIPADGPVVARRATSAPLTGATPAAAS